MPAFSKLFLVLASASGVVAVCLGAFGAHALKTRLDHAALTTWQTAVQYHFIHTLALVAVAVLLQHSLRNSALLAAAVLFSLGIVFFSGSLYGLALGGPRWLGPITPLGGTLFIAGWVSLLIYAVRS